MSIRLVRVSPFQFLKVVSEANGKVHPFMSTFCDYFQLQVQMKVREFSLHKEKERQIEQETKREKTEEEQGRQSEQSSSPGAAGEKKIKRSTNRITKFIGNVTHKFKNIRNRDEDTQQADEAKCYAQQPIEMNTFIRKRRLYFFPSMEKASYWIRENPDGSCSIVDK